MQTSESAKFSSRGSLTGKVRGISCLRVLVLVMLAFDMTVLSIIIPSARSNISPSPPYWSPFGPRMSGIQFQVYSAPFSEFNDFYTNNLDIMDVPPPDSWLGSLQGDSRFLVTNPSQMYDVRGIEFNHAKTFWGIPFNGGPSSAGIQVRQGIAHLIDHNLLVGNPPIDGKADTVDCFSTPLQGLPCNGPAYGSVPNWTPCSWDTMFPNCQSAYHLASQSYGYTYVRPGTLDFCAAASHFIAAGIATGKDPTSCVLTGLRSSAACCDVHNMVNLVIITEDPGLNALGNMVANGIDALMGWNTINICTVSFQQLAVMAQTETLGSISPYPVSAWDEFKKSYVQEGPMIPAGTKTPPPSSGPSTSSSGLTGFLCNYGTGDSDMYMMTQNWPMSWTLDQFYYGYYSTITGNGYNNPTLDTYSSTAAFSATFDGSKNAARAAEYVMGTSVANIPVYAPRIQYAYLNGWQKVIQASGLGPTNEWTALNAWNPAPALPEIRWGLVDGTYTLNVFRALSPGEWAVLGKIYDHLLAFDPMNPQYAFNWMTTSYSISYDQYGNTHILFTLRSDVYWHDSQMNNLPVTSDDVRFSFLNFRDAPAIALAAATSNIIDVTAYSSNQFDVVLSGQNVYYLDMIGSLPIIPKHIWDADNDGIVDPGMADLSFDPMALGKMIGSGPFLCTSRDSGLVGGSCTMNGGGSTGGGAVSSGGAILLQTYMDYMRCCPGALNSPLHIFSWANRQDQDYTVDIQELAIIGSVYGRDDPYWNTGYNGYTGDASHLRSFNGTPLPRIGYDPNTVDSGESVYVSYYSDHNLIQPFSVNLNPMPSLDYCLDPFFGNCQLSS